MAHIGRPSRGSTAFIRAMGVKVIFDTSQPATTLTAPALIPTDNFNGDGHGDILRQNSQWHACDLASGPRSRASCRISATTFGRPSGVPGLTLLERSSNHRVTPLLCMLFRRCSVQ